MKYIIGIDLGTTNCTFSYAQLDGEQIAPELQALGIPQASVAGESSTLPSFLYFPLLEEQEVKVAALPWDATRPYCVGQFARDRGEEVSSRLIASAKSWLCYSGIDRREKILPFGPEEDIPKMSPLEACSEFLRHLREAWEQHKPEAPFAEQTILVTVPASFDPSARQLVQEAAQLAGFPEVLLLEEPQAAFYAWLFTHDQSWRQQLHIGDRILVVDIGGGTTDFSLIAVNEEDGNLSLERQAVGAHLLLGGDNIDLALAYAAKDKLEEKGKSIDEWQLQSLVHTCRKAKEQLFSENAPASIDVTVLARGSKLIGGTLKTTLTKKEVYNQILEGFFPLVGPEERSKIEKRSGLQQVGLPFAQDGRISCQLAKFLSMTGENDSTDMDNFVLPTAVLFNGGTLKSVIFRERLLDLLNQWAKQLGKKQVFELPGADYDFAVSRGAAYYGWSRTGKGVRIKSGTSRSYYVGIEDAAPAVPGRAIPLKAICLAPFGMEEGTERELEGQQFSLLLGEQAAFRFFSRATPHLSDGSEPKVGTTVKNWSNELTELHPIEALLEKGESDGKFVRVSLKSRVTELGVLEVWANSPDGRKWKLEFDIRH